MADIIKTWPAFIAPRSIAQVFSERKPPYCVFYFTLGRGKPKEAIERIWWTYRGRILGYFRIQEIVVNDGALPRLESLDGSDSDWQIKKDAKVAVCRPPCVRLKERLYHEGFRGWRYFDIESYRGTVDARHRL